MAKIFLPKRDIYLDIADRYEKFIKLGVIKSGEKLPSVREAATELRVNPNTVQRAYSLLEEKGLIRAIPKKGAFVLSTNEENMTNISFNSLTRELLSLKEQGVSQDDVLSIIKEVYKND